MIVTYDELMTCKVKTDFHADSRDAAIWQAHIVEFPTLTRTRTFWRKAKRTVDVWFVDGAEVLDLEEAVEVMNGERLPIDDQIEALKRLVASDADGSEDRLALRSALTTLEWCKQNAQALRDFKATRRR